MTLHPYATALYLDVTDSCDENQQLLNMTPEDAAEIAVFDATCRIPDFTDEQKAEVYARLIEADSIDEDECNKALWAALS